MNARVVIIALLATAVGVYARHGCGLEAGYCQNGGICHDSATSVSTTNPGSAGNGWSTPACLCKAPYAGPACQYTVRECKDSPCKNGGTCVPADCQASVDDFTRFDCFKCQCAPGWTGSPKYTSSSFNTGGICDWPLPVGDCSVNQCLNGGTCTSINSPTVSTFSCACATGFKPSGTGNNCSIAFDCSVNAPACQNGGTCQGGTTCACGQYSGDQCQNPRWCDSNPCQNGGTCTNQNTIPTGGPTSRGFCSCTSNFAGTFCERPSFCSTNPCQNGGTCDLLSSTCTCTQGWEGANCTVPLFCSSNPCQNGANCTNTVSVAGGAGTCGPCPEGYAGAFCEKKIPGCGTPLVGCKVEHTTEFGTGNPSCKCTDQASCVGSNWDTKCSCQSGPTSARPNDGFHYDCRCNSTYVPKCPQQPLVSGTPGQYVDMVCENGGTCFESASTTGCSCRAGFWGDRCQFYDNPCRVSPCKNGGACLIVEETQGLPLDDRYWGRRCACRWPYYGETCEEVAPGPVVCTNNQCMNGATCGPRTYDSIGGFFDNVDGQDIAAPPYQCSCPAGYWGVFCERVREVCSASSCQNGGTCLDFGGNRIRCACTCGYAGERCEVAASNFNPAAALTFSAGGGVGYRLDFCSNSPCQNGGSCVNSLDGQGFGCLCKSGYYGTYCQYRGRSAAAGVAPSWIAVAAATVLVALQLIKF